MIKRQSSGSRETGNREAKMRSGGSREAENRKVKTQSGGKRETGNRKVKMQNGGNREAEKPDQRTTEKSEPGLRRTEGRHSEKQRAGEHIPEEKPDKVRQPGRETWRAGNMLYPLPAVMVSCQRPGEKPNIITVAWAGTVCSSPAMVSISVRPQRYSYGILKETGEFVINLTTEQLARATDYCGVRSGRDVDKFREMGLTVGQCAHVSAPLIQESPVNIECRVTQILELGSHHMFVAEVLGVDVDESYLDDKGKFQLNRAGLMVYSHGEYFGLGKKIGSFGYSVRKKKPGK